MIHCINGPLKDKVVEDHGETWQYEDCLYVKVPRTICSSISRPGQKEIKRIKEVLLYVDQNNLTN